MKIICIGRNYAAHIEELKNEKPGKPVVFLKPDTALLKGGAPFFSIRISPKISIMKWNLSLKSPKKANTFSLSLPIAISKK